MKKFSVASFNNKEDAGDKIEDSSTWGGNRTTGKLDASKIPCSSRTCLARKIRLGRCSWVGVAQLELQFTLIFCGLLMVLDKEATSQSLRKA